jgi:hypothetical protein
VRGAEFARELEAGWDDVDGDDGGRADGASRHHRTEPHRSRAGDSEARSSADAQRPPHRARTGLDAAAQRAEQLQRRVIADLDGVDLVRDGEGGEG